MMSRLPLVLLCLASLSPGPGKALLAGAAQAASIPPTAERAYRAVDSRTDERAALEIVTFMQQYWRLAGNPGYNASVDEISRRLTLAGFSKQPAGSAAFQRIDEYAGGSRGWDHSRATVTIEGETDPVFVRERDRVALAINSFSTAGPVTLRLIDVGRGSAADYEGKDVRGAVVLGDAGLGTLWREAVRNRGAAGVISTEIARYIRPQDPARMDDLHKDVLQWGSVPYDATAKAFGFKASWRAASRLRAALASNGSTRVVVDVQSAFYDGPARTLTAEIPGASHPGERIVIAAHLQEPGANDNASGCATLYALAAALNTAIREGRLPRPNRTITFLWLDEIRGSRQWLTARPDEAKGVRYMFSMDMTGEDTTRTGGTFLIEKQADPSAVWARPSDPHSEWGASQVKAESLRGTLLNDLHLAVAHHRARDTKWVVRTNPYEGGSDHTVFADAGVPSLLNWHFTDRFYHTNQDSTDKVSPAEMKNVAVTVATSAYLLAAATEEDALATVEVVRRAAVDRLALERRQGPGLVVAAADRPAAEQVEAQVLAAWIRWYQQALDSILTLVPADQPSAGVRAAVEQARAAVR